MSSQAKACMHVQCSVTPPRVARGAFFPPLCSLMVRIRCTVVAVFNDVCVCVCVCLCRDCSSLAGIESQAHR